ncbi:hypothetical protein BGZ60DRAFT_396941 [Tricladium varicosporioides]|nr:hypothetical protein BGZ60DRAFT_396941 [Hymenoscyphus varicosporioides]
MLLPSKRTQFIVRQLLKSHVGIILSLTTIVWLSILVIGKWYFWRDPHSAFFSLNHIYDFIYSDYRRSEANEFITKASRPNANLTKASKNPEICVAVATVKRQNTQYVDIAIGSLLEGLTESERERIYVHVLFADTHPEVHPSWKEQWLVNAIDSAAGYNVSSGELERLRKWEKGREFGKKGLYDYTALISFCHHYTTAPYTLILEDDIILADSWLVKTLHALRKIESQPQNPKFHNWLYLRLFFTETLLLWGERDFFYHHLALTLFLAISSSLIILLLVRYKFKTLRKTYLSNYSILSVCLITVPAFTVMFFMIGKNNLIPKGEIFNLNIGGCCSQALVFPRGKVGEITGFLREKGEGQTDSLLEQMADERGMERLALGRSVVQHVGRESSRDNANDQTLSMWAFYFEAYNPKKLAKEHKELLKALG